MSLEWTGDPTVFASERWEALRRADPEATFFHRPAYLKLYWEELGGPGLQVAFVGSETDPLAAAAFDLTEGHLTFLGGSEVTDYMGPVGSPSAREAGSKELLLGIARRDDWETADLAGLPEDGTWLGALAGAARDAGLEVRIGEDGIAPMLDLPPTWERYLGSLKARRRHEIRRKSRRLRERFPDARLVDSTPQTLEEDIEQFVRMHRSSQGEKGRFMGPEMQLFFRRLANALLPDGTFRLISLEAEGRKLAAAVGFSGDRLLSLYNSAYDRAQGRLAPGTVLLAELIRELIESGCERLDMLKGDLGYKYRFGARPRPIARLSLRRT